MSPKTVFITGSNRGIGLGLVRELLKDKEIETLIAGARNIEAAKDLQDFAKSDSRLHLISVDVSCDESLQKALKEVEGLVGDRGLNLLINNAAICPPYRTIDPPKRAVVLECLNVNAVGALVTAQLFLPLLRKAAAHTPGPTISTSKAAILNIGSDCASQTLNVTGFCDDTDFAYKMSKTAMLSFTRSMVADFKPLGIPVLVTTMHPGWVLTEMGGPNAKITIEESAADMVKSIGKLNETHNGGLFDRNLENMVDAVFPQQFSRAGNTTHTGEVFSIPQEEQFAYGTDGFRFRAEKLPFIVFRCAYVASRRARQLDSAIGVMITASHNPAADNGVKLVDPSGDMLSPQWKKYVTEIVNATDEDLPSAVRALEKQMSQVEKSRIASGQTKNARVVCGMDTRVSGPHLMSAARAGSALFNVQFVDIGIVTTPMLHYTVKSFNEPEFAEPTNQGYYRAISGAFKELYGITQEPEGSRYEPHVIVDCANGVGAPRLREFLEHIPGDMLEIELRNERGELNHDCGADFVKISQKMPTEFGKEVGGVEGKCVSFDGDADRILYFRAKGDSESAELFDGDRIAVLFAMYLKEQLDEFAAIKTNRLTMGIVQTAYANGASTRFIRDTLKIETDIVTNAKHLHEAASEFDVGIYFEANGHGTVVFSEQFNSAVRRAPSSHMCIRRLALFSRVINETVGDAFADLLAIEMCLRHFGWSMDDWNQKLYSDVPNILIKVPVDDRSIFKTTNAEQTLLKPSHQPRHNEDVPNTTMVTNGTDSISSDIESSRSWTESATSPTGLTEALESLQIQDESNTDFHDAVFDDSDDDSNNKTNHVGYPKKWIQKDDKDSIEIVRRLQFAKEVRKSKSIGDFVEYKNVFYEYREFRLIAGKSYDTEYSFTKWPQMRSYTIEAIGEVERIFWLLLIDKNCEDKNYVIKLPKKESFEYFFR